MVVDLYKPGVEHLRQLLALREQQDGEDMEWARPAQAAHLNAGVGGEGAQGTAGRQAAWRAPACSTEQQQQQQQEQRQPADPTRPLGLEARRRAQEKVHMSALASVGRQIACVAAVYCTWNQSAMLKLSARNFESGADCVGNQDAPMTVRARDGP